eukprot:CAMPEP_0206044034 /NCGR_PEP_ID=MMETSP1466-20131121/11353_1 /ASSEMBLY_ACC=CAM_ASM_001126 /TAXON_ID=44452 /ORGANISM="Pavlova gyrans, Strain CCMP608" /LENGTH=174 /DNA_ID=CAMNT_0053418913 /DNA_START=93 /DNA_END=617 /DNA_ORIENTATION=-
MAHDAVGITTKPGSKAALSKQAGIKRRDAFLAALPILAMRPLATLALSEYLPPGEETQEFKSLDQRATEFKRKQLSYKKKWEELTDKFAAARDDEEAMASLKAFQNAFFEEGNANLPEGVSRDAFLRTIRRKQKDLEAKDQWQKPVRMRFLDLKTAIDQSRRPKGMNDGAPVMG